MKQESELDFFERRALLWKQKELERLGIHKSIEDLIPDVEQIKEEWKHRAPEHDSRGFVIHDKDCICYEDSESKRFKQTFPYDTTPQERAERLKAIREAHESFERLKASLGLMSSTPQPITSQPQTQKEETIEPYESYEEEKKFSKINELSSEQKAYIEVLLRDSLRKNLKNKPMSIRQISHHLKEFHKIDISHTLLYQYRKKLQKEGRI